MQPMTPARNSAISARKIKPEKIGMTSVRKSFRKAEDILGCAGPFVNFDHHAL